MEKEEFINPIDIDKVALEPHLLPYSHSVGGVVIKPIDKGRIKGRQTAQLLASFIPLKLKSINK